MNIISYVTSLNSTKIRDVIIHIASHATIRLTQGHIDYAFQYKWTEWAEKSLLDITKYLHDLDTALLEGGDELFKTKVTGITRDPLTPSDNPIVGHKYWKHTGTSS